MSITSIVLTAVCCLTIMSMMAFALECICSLLPINRRRKSDENNSPRTSVLIPAHNEESVIEQTLNALMPTLPLGGRVVVVADNCNDRTAEIAESIGAEAIVRNDPARRGKGYALQFGLAHLRGDPPDAVVILDADCLVIGKAVQILAAKACETGRPVQSLNLTDREPAESSLRSLAILANRFTNLVRPLGLLRLGMPCRLMGTGMAFPWSIAENLRLSGENIVEDLQLGIDLAVRGHLPLFCPEARVTSALPPQNKAYLNQRKRWEHGTISTAIRQVPRLLWHSLLRLEVRLLAMALDLSIPPLALMAVAWVLQMGVALLLTLFGVSWMPAVVTAFGGLAAAGAFAAAWAAHCRRQVAFSALIAAPKYFVRKSPIYFGLLFDRQRAWIRTDRELTTNTDIIRRDQSHELPEGVGSRDTQARL
jgi:cellulose synthase/poly-beta-1,6-N-acetylglucosamine synthase-like glycosyltransferase